MTTLMATQSRQADEETRLVQQSITDANAFAELYRRHASRVYRYHVANTGNVKDAEDLTSQTFMAALEGIRSFRGTGSFAAWIMGIASKKRLMHFRRSGNRLDVPLDAAIHHPSPDTPPDHAVIQRMQFESVCRALSHISQDRAEAITLSYFGGLTNSGVSQVMNKSEAAVKMLISRGLQDLRERTSLILEVE